MKHTLCLPVIALLFSFSASAQEFTDFGIVSSEEINLKECAFDKEAEAVVLLNEAVAGHDDEYHLITNHHVRIKILKEKGFSAADVKLNFYRKDDFEFIDMLDAMVINTNGQGEVTTEKLSRKSFYEKKINDRIGAIIFTFPNIKVGSIIEYKYRSFMKSYNGLDDWDFQMELPVVKSKYTLTVLPTTEFAYVVNKKAELPATARVEKETGKVYFEMNNIPALTNEPYMDAREDYLQKVTFQLSGYNNNGSGKVNFMTSWDEVIRELLTTKEFGTQLGKNISGTGAFTDGVKMLATEENKMKAVYNYVRSNMTWNEFYSKYSESVKDAWEKKKGTSGDINLILVNLLKEVGLEAYPVLVSERFHGKVNVEYPFVDQFNSVFACVVIKEKKYYLDATDAYTPAHIIPSNILNTTALIINKKNGGLVNITNDSLQYRDSINVQITADEKGSISGETYRQNTGYSRIKAVTEFKEDGQQKYIDHHFNKEGFTVTGFEFLNQNSDSMPAEQKFKFSAALTGTGDYLFVPLNLFTGFEKNPFISDNRFSNINFGYKRTITIYTAVKLPANYDLDALPKPVKMITPGRDIEMNRVTGYDKAANLVTCAYEINFKKSLYTVDEYRVLQDVYKKFLDFLNEPVVLKKKK